MDIKYRCARSVEEALELAAKTRGKTFYLAGGTDLTVLSKAGRIPSGLWIDISKIPDLKGIREEADHHFIGSGTTFAELERSAEIRLQIPALWQAAISVGSPQIRSVATVGGNFANASPAGDIIPPMLALSARVLVQGLKGKRKIAATEFFRGVRLTALENGELITGFELPRYWQARSVFLKIGPRKALAISKVSVAAALEMDQGAVSRVQIALGAVAPTVVRAPQAESFLAGKRPTPDVLLEACRLARSEVHPITDFRSTEAYRREMAGTLVARALETLCDVPLDRRGGWDVEMR